MHFSDHIEQIAVLSWVVHQLFVIILVNDDVKLSHLFALSLACANRNPLLRSDRLDVVLRIHAIWCSRSPYSVFRPYRFSLPCIIVSDAA